MPGRLPDPGTMSRNKLVRQRRILQALEERPSLRVVELAARMSVSAETIRRDLDEMTREGLLERTYGGAVRRLSREPAVNERHAMRVPEREAIARAAGPLIVEARHLMIGSGATTVHVARRIAVERRDLSVITHAFGVATVLSLNPTIETLVAPGRYHAGEGAVHGAETLAFLDQIRVDWAILGASGLTAEGPSDALIEAGRVYAAMLRRASHRMVVADSSKFGRAFPSCWAVWDEIDVLVTETAPPETLRRALDDAGTRVVIAG